MGEIWGRELHSGRTREGAGDSTTQRALMPSYPLPPPSRSAPHLLSMLRSSDTPDYATLLWAVCAGFRLSAQRVLHVPELRKQV